jgi:hypothetical protein
MHLSGIAANVTMSTTNPRGGIDLKFGGMNEVQLSETWSVAGWDIRFLALGPGVAVTLEAGNNYVKVVTGRLANIDRGCFARPFTSRSTRLSVTELVAGFEGALVALMVETAAVPENLNDMKQLIFKGPHAECLNWQRFDEKFGGFIDYFDGLDCHMANGLHLLNEGGAEICYVNFWTCGQGVDLSTHNHGQAASQMAPAFAEVHWVFNNGSGLGGMYETAEPGDPDRVRHPMARGEEHGPYFDADESGKLPRLSANGAVEYPWHGWQGGLVEGAASEQVYDFVAAFEINPMLARL